MESNDPLIGLTEAAMMLRIPYQDAHRLLMLGVLQGTKVRGRWMVSFDKVVKLLPGKAPVPRTVTE